MKNIHSIFSILIVLLALIACAGDSHKHDAHNHSESATLHDHTLYTASHELFVQMPQLAVGTESHITAYITELENFKPVPDVPAQIVLAVGDSRVVCDVAPVHRGMYEFHIKPEKGGKGVLTFLLHYPAGDAEMNFLVSVVEECHHHHSDSEHNHDHSAEHNHAHNHSAEVAHSHESVNAISFLKEQSWKIDFATAEATESSFDGTVKVAAVVSPVPQNTETLVATAPGRVVYVGNLAAGKKVSADETLILLDGSGVTENDASVRFAESESNYNVAKADYERKLSLYKDNIVSKKEVEAAEALLHQAEAQYNSMKRSFDNGGSVLKSSMKGTVSALLVKNGEYVSAGTPVAVLQCEGAVNLSAELPVRFASSLTNLSTVNVELSNGAVFSLEQIGGSIVAVGSAANECNMIPVTVNAKNLQGVVPGSIVTLYLSSTLPDSVKRVVVPRSALVEEMGNYFVFVQLSPVSFEKREVKIGSTDGIYTQVLKGLHAGERIVTKGAVSLKLSQGAAALDPHAGHVH